MGGEGMLPCVMHALTVRVWLPCVWCCIGLHWARVAKLLEEESTAEDATQNEEALVDGNLQGGST